jgi:hypothetical protein
LLALGVGIGIRDIARSTFYPLDGQLDFRPLYCTGVVVGAREDPYQIEPLRSCEHRYAVSLLARSPHLLMPFVLPGYDAAPLWLLAKLPFAWAEPTYTLLSCTALVAAIALVAYALRVPLVLAAGTLGLSVGLPSIALGQLAPFELLALAATAAALRAGRDREAGALAALTLLDPHVGLFVCVATALLVSRARMTLGLGLAGLAVADVFTVPGGQLAYLTSVLPLQASAQARAPDQYSLTFLLAVLGATDRAALALGAVSTAALLAAGVAFAQRWSRLGERAGVAFAPAACAVIAGSYVHITQIAFAVPAALLLLRTAPTRTTRALAGTALVLLAVPWPYPAIVKNVLALSLVSCAIALWFATDGSLRLTVAGLCACMAVLVFAENHAPGPLPPPLVRQSPAGSSYETQWRDAIGREEGIDAFHLAEKFPTWLGLVALLGAGGLVVRRPSRAA